MEGVDFFNRVRERVRIKENEVVKNYNTIGGFWNVDTWKKGNISYQIMDEGYTERIFIRNRLDVIRNYEGSIIFRIGDLGVLKEVSLSL